MSNERCKSTVFVVVSASTPPAWRRRRRFARFTATRTAACSARKALATAMNGAVRGCRLRCFDVWRWMGKHNTICSMTQVGSDVLNMCFGFFAKKRLSLNHVEETWPFPLSKWLSTKTTLLRKIGVWPNMGWWGEASESRPVLLFLHGAHTHIYPEFLWWPRFV